MIFGLSFGDSSLAKPTSDFNLRYPHIPGQLIVKYKPGFVKQATKFVKSLGGNEKYRFQSNGAFLFEFPQAKTAATLLAVASELAKSSSVDYVEANSIYHSADTVPNDPKYPETYGLSNDGRNQGIAGADIDMPRAWDIVRNSKNIMLGVIDSGVDYGHDDLKANIWRNPGESGTDSNGQPKESNGIDDDMNGYIDDFHGWDFANNDNDPMDDFKHGTHVAGTIGAAGNDGIGLAGINWTASIIPIKFLNENGSGSLENAVKSIEYATAQGIRVVNASWGGSASAQTLEDAVKVAERAGMLFVAAAGNNGSNNDRRPFYPASIAASNVLSVGATDRRDERARFSNFGKQSVHLFAPGVDILSTTRNGAYELLSGTSMAAPHVAGVAALVMANKPSLTFLEVKNRIISSSEPLESLNGDSLFGSRLNAYNALEADTVPPGTVTGIRLATSELTSVLIEWGAAGDDGQAGFASRYLVKVSGDPITSEDEWSAGDEARTIIQQESNQVLARIINLPFNTEGYVTVRAVDNVGNLGPISRSAVFRVAKSEKIYVNAGDAIDGTANDSWGIEAITATNNGIADSPGTDYPSGADTTMSLPEFLNRGEQCVLSIRHKFEFEPDFDFGYIEISTDGGAVWKNVATFTGQAEMATTNIDLHDALAGHPNKFLIRFRVVADGTITKSGWIIDEAAIFAPARARAMLSKNPWKM
jgi:hypothetical protein